MDKEYLVYIYIYIYIYTHTHIYTYMYIHKHIHTHTVEYSSAIKMNKIVPFAATWMNPEIIK